MFLRLFLSIYVIYLASIHRGIAEIATFSRLQERVINVRWCCFCARLFWLGHCRTPGGADGRFASSAERRTRRSCVFFINLLLLLLLMFILLCCCPCRCCYRCWACFLGCLRSYNCCIDQNLWSVLFQTTSFVYSLIHQSSHITKPHPPPVFIAPRIHIISKNGVFIPKQAIFTHFPLFFARSSVKYQPISKWFSF